MQWYPWNIEIAKGIQVTIVVVGGTNYIADMDQDSADSDQYVPMGSIFVKPGCSLYMFYKENFTGNKYRIMNNDVTF